MSIGQQAAGVGMTLVYIWKRYGKLLLLATTVLAFFAGRGCTTPPAKVEKVEKAKEVFLLDEKKMAAEVERRVAEFTSKLKVKVTERKETKPDKTVIEEKVTEIDSDTKAKVDEAKAKTEVVEKLVFQDREVIKREVIEAARKDWRIGPLVTMNIPGAILGNPAFEFGAQAQFLVPKLPVYVAASLTHRLTVGLSIGGEF